MQQALLCLASTLAFAAALDLPAAETNSVPAASLMVTDDTLKRVLFNALAVPDSHHLLSDPLTNRVWQSSHPNAVLGLLNDLHLKPKVFQTRDSTDNAVLGFEYAYDKSLAGRTISPEGDHPLGLSFNLFAKGNVAFDRKKNPDDFLETGARIHLFQALGGLEPLLFSENAARAMNEAAIKATEIQSTGAEREKDPRWKAVADIITRQIRAQLLYDVAANFSLESNQSFANKQWTYGGQVGVVLRDWRDDSIWPWFNLLDYPFAAIRCLTSSEPFQPSGHAIPAIIAGLDLVDPFNDHSRLAVDPGDDPYPRFRGEVAFKTLLGRLFEKEVWFSAGYRYFKELGASTLIRSAGFAEQSYLAARIDFLNGFSLSYSNGTLPLDRDGDQVVALGYTIRF